MRCDVPGSDEWIRFGPRFATESTLPNSSSQNTQQYVHQLANDMTTSMLKIV